MNVICVIIAIMYIVPLILASPTLVFEMQSPNQNSTVIKLKTPLFSKLKKISHTVLKTLIRKSNDTSLISKNQTPNEAPIPIKKTEHRNCRDPQDRSGYCIALVDCEELREKLKTRLSDDTFLNYLATSNLICEGFRTTIICCPTNSTQSVPKGRRLVNTNEIPLRLPTVQDGCGCPGKSIHNRVIGGEVSKIGAWPWVALVGYDGEPDEQIFKCAGTLITARHVVTSAHCISSNLRFVRLGEHDLSTETETKHIDIIVVRAESHPSYNSRNGHSDIAILYLRSNVEFTDLISPICLPITPELVHKSYVGCMPFVVGWGKTAEDGMTSNVLRELQIPVHENNLCRETYKRMKRSFTTDQFDSAVICAGILTGNRDTCSGDSGGPLMMPEPYGSSVRYYLIGIVAYSIGCARKGIPAVYASTQHFIDWIVDKVASS